jgi:cytoskeleton protein RodZ
MTETNTIAAEAAPAPDPFKATPGEYLRKLREEKGHSYAIVGSALHLTVHYIKALESDDYGKLPGLTFVKGYLRAYARFLGGDVDRVLALFDGHIAGLLDAGKHTARVERSKRRQDQALRWGIGAGFVVVASLVAGWWFLSDRTEPVETVARTVPAEEAAVSSARTTTAAATPRVSTAPPASTTVVLPIPPPEPGAPVDTSPEANAAVNAAATVTPAANGARQVSLVSAGDDELRVLFNGNSWIEVDDGSLVRIYQDMLAAGDTLTIRGEAPFHVLLGDASSVEVSLNAAAVDISADIRDDSTARLVLGAPAGVAPGGTPQSTQESAPEAPL